MQLKINTNYICYKNKYQYQSQTNLKTSLNIHGLATYNPSDITSQTKIDGNILIALKYI